MKEQLLQVYRLSFRRNFLYASIGFETVSIVSYIYESTATLTVNNMGRIQTNATLF